MNCLLLYELSQFEFVSCIANLDNSCINNDRYGSDDLEKRNCIRSINQILYVI